MSERSGKGALGLALSFLRLAQGIIRRHLAPLGAHLAEQFEEIERDRVGVGKHEAYHAMLHTLKDLYGVA